MKIERTDFGVCIDDFRASGVRDGKYGLTLIVNDDICETAGVFTSNNLKAAPVLITKERIVCGLKAIIANSGNANSCVKGSVEDAKKMSQILADKLGINPDNIGVASTGIIGRRLDLDIIERLVGDAIDELSNSPQSSKNAAKAIMTTDTKPKEISFEYKGIKIGGICKGSGMIAPNMATMLCFLTTNADLNRKELQNALEKAVENSFNMLVVDGDMSTNDMVILMSNRKKSCSLEDFQHLLNQSTMELTKMMAIDGEGATKFLEVEVNGAETEGDARTGAISIVSSPLVKTAVYGENPNWGRIVSSLGSKLKFEFEKTDITFESEKGSAQVLEKGRSMNLEKAENVLMGKEIRITVNLNSGNKKATAFGCDLTPEYVKINAGYN